MEKKLKIAVLISGRGSNLQAIIDSCTKPDFPAEIVAVASNKPGALGLKRAEKAGITHYTVNHKDYETREAFEEALLQVLKLHNPDLICLAGFMRVFTPYFVEAWPRKSILNIHPSLLPLYKGSKTHELVIENGDRETGCTVHYVTEELDSGEIILQKKIDVLEGDTPETLAARLLPVEHQAYPEAIETIARQKWEEN